MAFNAGLNRVATWPFAELPEGMVGSLAHEWPEIPSTSKADRARHALSRGESDGIHIIVETVLFPPLA